MTAVFHQRQQNLESFWRERYGLALAQQRAFIRVDSEWSEFVTLFPSPNYHWFNPAPVFVGALSRQSPLVVAHLPGLTGPASRLDSSRSQFPWASRTVTRVYGKP